MNEQDQRYFDNKFKEFEERFTKLDRALAILLERTKPTLDSYS